MGKQKQKVKHGKYEVDKTFKIKPETTPAEPDLTIAQVWLNHL